MYILIIFLIILFIPFPFYILPSMDIQLIYNKQPLCYSPSVSWQRITDYENISGENINNIDKFDNTGHLHLPAHYERHSICKILSAYIFRHIRKSIDNYGELTFYLPEGYTIDENSMNLKYKKYDERWNLLTWKLLMRDEIEFNNKNNKVRINIYDFTETADRNYQIYIRSNSSAERK